MAGIVALVVRNLPAIKKADDFEVKKGFWNLMFIEFVSFYRKIPFREYKQQSIGLYEKFLRRLKIVSLKVENKTSKWLERLPKEESKDISSRQISDIKARDKKEVKKVSEEDIRAAEESNFKKEEKRLITEIAKFPQNADLYKELGALYVKNNVLDDAKEALKVAVELDSEDRETAEILNGISK